MNWNNDRRSEGIITFYYNRSIVITRINFCCVKSISISIDVCGEHTPESILIWNQPGSIGAEESDHCTPPKRAPWLAFTVLSKVVSPVASFSCQYPTKPGSVPVNCLYIDCWISFWVLAISQILTSSITPLKNLCQTHGSAVQPPSQK